MPAGVLAWGKTYRWAVQVYDGALYSTATPSTVRYAFTTPAPQAPITVSLSSNGENGFALGAPNYTTEATDAQVASVGPELSVQRFYNSADPRLTSAFGSGWSSLADTRVIERRDASGALLTAAVRFPAGNEVAFARAADGSFVSPPGNIGVFTAISGGYQLIDHDRTTYKFTANLGGGSYGLTSMADVFGRPLTVTWASGRPATLASASGRALQLGWATPAGASIAHVTTVTDGAANQWSYEYAADQLTKVCPPTNPLQCTVYGYANASLYSANVSNLDPYSYWRLGEASGTKVASEVEARMGVDAGTYANVTLGQPGPLSGTTATAASFNGTSSRVSLPASPALQTGHQSISLWFKQTAGDGTLYSQSWDPITSTSTNGAYAPILYTGSDGKLYGQFPTATAVGAQYSLSNYASGKCLKADVAVNYEQPYLYDCTGGETKYFTLDSSQRLTMTIGGVTKCLDAMGGQNGDGTDVILYTCSTGDNQKWTIHPDGRVVGKDSGRCLDTFGGGTANGTKLVLWTCKKATTASQSWFPTAHSPMVSTATVNDGAWHHVVLSASGTSQKMYLDGAEVASKSGTIVDISPRYAYLGAGFIGGRWPKPTLTSSNTNAGTPDFFTGSIAEVAQFNRALTAAEATSLYAAKGVSGRLSSVTRPSGNVDTTVTYDPKKGVVSRVTDNNGAQWTLNQPTVSGSSLIHASNVLGAAPIDYWRMKETGEVADAVNEVNGSVATYNNVTLGAANSGPFSDAPAAQFNGADSSVTADGPSVDTVSSFSISAWAKLTSAAANQRVVSVVGQRVPAAWLGFNTSANRWQFAMYQSDMDNPASSRSSSTTAPVLNQWTHLVGTYDGATRALTLYVNGVAQPSVTVGGTAWSASGPLYIGRGLWNGNGADFWSGPLAEVATYGAVLNQQQISAQYASRDQASGSVPARRVTLTGPSQETIAHVYDTATGRKVAEFDGLGNEAQFGYDLKGFVHTLVDPNNNVTINERDVRGNLSSSTTCQDYSAQQCSTSYYTYWPDSTSTVLTPDPRNNVLLTERGPGSTSATDPTYLTTYTYDTAGQRTAATDPLGRSTTVTYTDGTTVAAADGGFAPPGLPASSTTAGGALTRIVYYQNGDVASVTDPAGAVTRYTYDALGRTLTETEVTGSYPAGLTTSYAYDALGRVVTETGPAFTNRVTGAVHTPVTTMVYDEDDQITSQTVSDATGGDAPRSATMAYNARGQMSSETDAAGKTTGYTYDAYGRVVQVAYADGNVVRSTFDVNGNELQVVLTNWTGDPNNPSTPADLVLNSMTYDPAGQLVSVTDAMNWVTEYEYTDNGLLTKVTRRDPGTGQSYVYENNTYDPAENLVSQTTNNGLTTIAYTYDAAGRGLTGTLDPTGLNRKTTYAYSPEDDVVETTMSDPTGTLARSQTLYDPLGRVLATTTYPGNELAPVGRWRLDESSGTTAADSAGNSTATATGGVTWSTERGGSVVLDGAVGSKISTTGPVVDTARSFTVSAWVRLDVDPASNKMPLSQDGTSDSGFFLQYVDSVNQWRFVVCAGNIAVGTHDCTSAYADTAVPSVGAWTHLTGVYDREAGEVRVYVDGQLDRMAARSGAWSGATGPLRIGGGKWSGNLGYWWPGAIDDVQVYQKALSSSEVSAVYAGSAPAADASVIRTSYTLGNGGDITAVTDPKGNTTQLDNDELGRPVVSISPEIMSVTGESTPAPTTAVSWVGYNTFGEEVESKDPNGNTTTYRYDAVGRLIATELPAYTPPGSSTPLAAQTRHEYDSVGQLTKTIDPLGGETSYLHDQLGRVAKVTAPDLAVSTYTYTLTGEELSHTDPTGARVTSTYDYLGRTRTSTEVVRQDNASYTTTFNYGSGTWPASITSPAGVVNSFTYNKAGEYLSVKDGANNTTTFVNDGLGRQTKVTLPDGTYSTMTFDGAGRALAARSYSAANALLREVSNRYDANGNVVAATDARGTTTTFAYDATDLLVSQVEPISGSDSIGISFGYDPAGNQTRFVDGRGNPFITTYNSWGLPEQQIEPATAAYPALADRTFTFSYDVAGRLARATSPGGVTVDSTYDAMGRLTLQTGAGAEAATANREFGYDLAGRVVSLSGSGGTNALTYDDRGLLRSVTGPVGSSAFTYNSDGAMASRQDAAGSTTYVYDSAGRLASLSNPGAGVALGYAYDSLSQVSSITYGSGGNKREFTYDSLHRLTADELTAPAGASIAKISYGWDVNDNMTSKTTTGFSGSAANTYSYDLANRIIGWDNGIAPVLYGYDKSGNRVQAGGKTFTHDERNQLQSASDGTTYQYTARGTLRHTTSGTVTGDTAADAFGQVVSHQEPGGATSTYSYDGLGRAIQAGFAYTGLGNTLAADAGASYVRGPGDELVGVASGGVQRLAWTDLHTDVVGQFTVSSTTLDASTTYDPYGSVIASSGMLGNLGYQSGWTDFGTGRVNMWSRWYNPQTGQFDTRDSETVSPVPGSVRANRFAYGDANPMTRIDPTGHKTESGEDEQWCKKDYDECLLDIANAEVRAYERALARAQREAHTSLFDILIDFGVGMLLDMIGYYDVVNCFGKGDVMACVSLALDVIGPARAIKLGAKIVKAAKAGFKAYKWWKRIVDGAKALAKKARKLLDDARKWANDLKKKVGGKPKAPKKPKTKKLRKPKAKPKPPKKPKPSKQAKPKRAKKAPKKVNRPKNDRPRNDRPKNKRDRDRGKDRDRDDSETDNDRPDSHKNDRREQPEEESPEPAACPVSWASHSFDPNTRVLMADGTSRPISEVNIGDEVVATDPATGQTTSQPVTMLHLHRDSELTDLTVSSSPAATSAETVINEGEGDRSTRGPTTTVLHTTQTHPFWDATTGNWTDAADLIANESTLVGPDGQVQYVIAVDNYTATKNMRDLTVDRVHTYYVIAGNTPVLVHNCGGGPEVGNGSSGMGISGDPYDPVAVDSRIDGIWRQWREEAGGPDYTSPPQRPDTTTWQAETRQPWQPDNPSEWAANPKTPAIPTTRSGRIKYGLAKAAELFGKIFHVET